MTDLIERLRLYIHNGPGDDEGDNLMAEAINEIERLRKNRGVDILHTPWCEQILRLKYAEVLENPEHWIKKKLMTNSEVAERLDFPASRVQRIHKEAINKFVVAYFKMVDREVSDD